MNMEFWVQIATILATGLSILGYLKSSIERLEKRIDKLEEKMTDIDRRLCRIEGVMSAKECCMLKEHPSKKAE